MNLVRRNQHRGAGLARFQDEMNNLFSRFFADSPLTGFGDRDAWWPVLDLAEEDDRYVVTVELPGVKKDEVDLTIHDRTLVLSGEKHEEQEERREGRYHSERCYGSFRREITLPVAVDPDKVKADFADGVLTIAVPKSEKARPKKIEVNA